MSNQRVDTRTLEMEKHFFFDYLKSKARLEMPLLGGFIDTDSSNLETAWDHLTSGPAQLDLIVVAASYQKSHRLNDLLPHVKKEAELPCFLWPKAIDYVCDGFQGIMLPVLISGRNPEFLFGRHVALAPKLSGSNTKIIPTGYMMIGSDSITEMEYLTNTLPIPLDKPNIAICTAMAAEMIGMSAIMVDFDTSLKQPASLHMIRQLREHVRMTLLVKGRVHNHSDHEDLKEIPCDVLLLAWDNH